MTTVSADAPLCGNHEAYICTLGGGAVVGQLVDLEFVRWQRIRDDISRAQVRIGPYICCELMSTIEPVRFELHIHREGELVWQGTITRIEFENDGIDIFGEDMLWVAKRRALEQGYNFGTFEGQGPTETLSLIQWLLVDQCYAKYGDAWNMASNINIVTGPDDPRTTSEANAWSVSIWEALDALGERGGVDYTVVSRQFYAWDIHLDWNPIADLEETDIGEYPRIVEYGNQYANRIITTNGSGYAGLASDATAPSEGFPEFVDIINRVDQQSAATLDPITGKPLPPSPEDLESWTESSNHQVTLTHPMPRAIVVPENSTLMPSSPWDVNTLMPGSWFTAHSSNACRTFSEYQRLHELNVIEDGIDGELVTISTASAPSRRVTPT